MGLVDALFAHLVARGDVLQGLQDNQILGELLRREALACAERYLQDSNRLNGATTGTALLGAGGQSDA